MLAGRQPLPNHPGEVMVDQIAARDLHLRVGSRLEMGAGAGTDFRHIRRLSEGVVGIMVNRGSVVVNATGIERSAVNLPALVTYGSSRPSSGREVMPECAVHRQALDKCQHGRRTRAGAGHPLRRQP
jgi:hypothetical protein